MAAKRTSRLEIRRIALLKDDTIALGPSVRFPATDKRKDSRYPWFVQNHGAWCWELDALSPNVLRDRVEQAILDELDLKAWDRYVEVERLEMEAIADTCRSWNSKLGQVPE